MASAQSTSGEPSDNSSNYLIRVSPTPLSLSECNEFVSHPSCGAISSFVGITRDNFGDKKVAKLSYEGYVPMAERELRRLCDIARSKFDIHRIAVVHILGDCPVGESSVIIAASSPHRRDSLDCVSFLIDELKASVPIWKREVYEGDEDSVWKENIEWQEGQKKRVMVKE
eukprot:CAMPEP_0195529058 /NCGR_PEP_ID=MMETSP0794_2-20130614/31477_1 /TAXON_ID=515487 /ORGANISM="Stephanopyxis turris, Strain CCMP 815" /LENGTH=169 /DNA_ID=CAMNT_0040660301 /DNA_START=58 /DNA_END=570 /DNA_ORIENTATION=+